MRTRKNATAAARAFAVLAAGAVALGLGSAAQAADTDADLEAGQSSPLNHTNLYGLGEHRGPFGLTVTNNGPAVSTNWTAEFTLPGSIVAPDPELVSVEGPGECVISGLVVTCSGAELAVGATFEVLLTPVTVAYGEGFIGTTTSGDQFDPRTTMNNAGQIEAVQPDGDLVATDPILMAPGESQDGALLRFRCPAVTGCEYGTGTVLIEEALPGGSFVPGTATLYQNDNRPIGDCVVTETVATCTSYVGSHLNTGNGINARGIVYQVDPDAPLDTPVFQSSIVPPADHTGNDPANDSRPISTPTEVGAPIVSWQVALPAGLLLALGALVARRRRTGTPAAA